MNAAFQRWMDDYWPDADTVTRRRLFAMWSAAWVLGRTAQEEQD